jgi:hypothetical protein
LAVDDEYVPVGKGRLSATAVELGSLVYLPLPEKAATLPKPGQVKVDRLR